MTGERNPSPPSVSRQSRAVAEERRHQNMVRLEKDRTEAYHRQCREKTFWLKLGMYVWGLVAVISALSLMIDGPYPGTWFLLSVAILLGWVCFNGAKGVRGRMDAPLFLKDEEASAALATLSLLMAELKRPERTTQSMISARDLAAQHLQTIHAAPLTDIPRGHYDPDEHGFEEQWSRLRGAIRDFDAQVASDRPHTVEQVENSVRWIVRTLRPMLARYELEGSAFDLRGAPLAALETPTKDQRPAKPKDAAKAKKGRTAALPAPTDLATALDQPLTGRVEALDEAEPKAAAPDAFTPVEGMLNVSAEMSVAAIRMLILRLKTIDRSAMPDLDVQSSNMLVDQHVPSLVKAYMTAHDLAPVDDRDEVRAEFARTLRVVRDTLTDVLERHAREARRLLEDEGRFLAARGGQSDL